jgi:predicted amidohydrolase
MKTAVIQAPLVWEDAAANREYFQRKIDQLTNIDLIVLPEMFSSGFTMQPSAVAEKMDGMTVIWMQAIAKARNCAVTGSIVIEEDGHFYNRLLFVFPSGAHDYYDKRHLFTLAGEDKAYTAGKDRLIVNYMGWKICPLICYDLRFPVFARNNENYDLLIYVANWPQPRINAWDILLIARAVENMSYVIGVNRIGEDQNKHRYVGHSQVIDAMGNYVAEPSEGEAVIVAMLDKSEQDQIRTKLAFLDDRDDFTVV